MCSSQTDEKEVVGEKDEKKSREGLSQSFRGDTVLRRESRGKSETSGDARKVYNILETKKRKRQREREGE